MAYSKSNPFLFNFSGKVGNMIIKRYGDKIVLSTVPDMRRRVLTDKQKELNLLMKYANGYAKSIVADPARKYAACRELLLPPNRVFRALVKEFMLRKGEVNELIPKVAEK